MSAPATPSSRLRVRTLILSLGVFFITATGAWYGASLKTNQQLHTQKSKILEATTTPAEEIASLEERKAVLMAKRAALERKIEGLEKKRRNGEEGKTVHRSWFDDRERGRGR